MNGRVCQMLMVLFNFLVLNACQNNAEKHFSPPAISFNSQQWLKYSLKERGVMVDSLLARKDSLLVNRSKNDIELLLGSPDEKDMESISYYFEKKYSNDIVVLSYIYIRFDTITSKCVDAWWTD